MIDVAIINDNTAESNETFKIVIYNVNSNDGSSTGNGETATVTIINRNDGKFLGLTLLINRLPFFGGKEKPSAISL